MVGEENIKIFPNNLLPNKIHLIIGVLLLKILKSYSWTVHRNDTLRNLLINSFTRDINGLRTELTMQHLGQKKVIISTCLMNQVNGPINYSPAIFTNIENISRLMEVRINNYTHNNNEILDFVNSDIGDCSNYRLSDIALATSAAFPYLPPVKVHDHCYIDGGFYFNNIDFLTI